MTNHRWLMTVVTKVLLLEYSREGAHYTLFTVVHQSHQRYRISHSDGLHNEQQTPQNPENSQRPVIYLAKQLTDGENGKFLVVVCRGERHLPIGILVDVYMHLAVRFKLRSSDLNFKLQ